ncbi:MAG: hypothetical protein SGBAC_007961 [Bacillariaceae sp.]
MTTATYNSVLPSTMDRTCLEDNLAEHFNVTPFTLSLEEDAECSVSVIDEDDASFLGESYDDSSSVGSASEEDEEDVLAVFADDLEISARTETTTDNTAPKSIAVVINPLLTQRRPLRQRRRGGRRPVKRGQQPVKVQSCTAAE